MLMEQRCTGAPCRRQPRRMTRLPTATRTDHSDLAIEVVLSGGRISKLEVYRGLGVHEVWGWKHGRILVFVLVGDRYRPAPRSRLFPDLDLDRLVTFVDFDRQTEAARAGGRRCTASRRAGILQRAQPTANAP